MRRIVPALLALGSLAGCRATGSAHRPEPGSLSAHAHDEHGSHGYATDPGARGHGAHDEEPERAPPLGATLRGGWCAPADHVHESRCGTPYVHAFHAEPAFLGRDLLLHLEREGDDHAIEAELEWALTRRLLFLAELPYEWTESDDGVADVGVGLRALLVETNHLLLSAQLGVELPTGSGDLTADEVVVAPSLLSWVDVGHWFTVQTTLAVEVGADSGDAELAWGGVLGKSFAMDPLLRGGRCGGSHEHGHGTYLSLFLEGRGSRGLSGEEEGSWTHEALFGVSLPVSRDVEARAGHTLRWDDEVDAEPGWVLGLVLHL